MVESNFWVYLLISGFVIVIGLAFYAGKLLSQVKAQKVAKEKALAAVIAGHNKHDEKIMNSVMIIVRAMKEEQCDYSEGCWRLCVLLESLKNSASLEGEFPAIFELYNKIKHMKILGERKELPKRERMIQDVDRMKAEAALYDGINNDLKSLFEYTQQKLADLQSA